MRDFFITVAEYFSLALLITLGALSVAFIATFTVLAIGSVVESRQRDGMALSRCADGTIPMYVREVRGMDDHVTLICATVPNFSTRAKNGERP